MKRGEIWTIAGGPDYAGKPRPAVVVQDDAFDATNSVTVCAFTTVLNEATSIKDTDIRPLIDPSELNGLRQPSQVMVDKITSLPVARFGQRIGQMAPDDLAAVDEALIVFLGLARVAP